MTYLIGKSFTFDASHVLDGLPPDHKCGRLHGHTYVVEVAFAADDLDTTGFVVDYGDLARFKAWLDATFDHRHLNDRLDVNPTAENLAHAIARRVPEHVALPDGVRIAYVEVRETPKTYARWMP